MYDRSTLKDKGRKSFLSNYGQSVVTALIAIAIPVIFALFSNIFAPTVIGNLLAVLFAILYACVYCLLGVGICRFYIRNTKERARVREILDPFQNGHSFGIIGKRLVTQLIIGLWSLLLIVPGVIRMYDYYLVPYLLAENPGISGKKARSLSREWMNGYKRRLFIMDLSFTGWILLAVVTVGLAGMFYVFPYVNAAHAEFYVFLRDQTRSSGTRQDFSDQKI